MLEWCTLSCRKSDTLHLTGLKGWCRFFIYTQKGLFEWCVSIEKPAACECVVVHLPFCVQIGTGYNLILG